MVASDSISTSDAAFFSPDAIYLIVGASNNTEKFGSKVFLDLHHAGLNAVGINNHEAEIHGTPAFPSISAFLDKVGHYFDEKKRREALAKIVVVLIVPPKVGLAVVEEAHLHGITKVWFQPGAESDEAIAFCERTGMRCAHDACIMVERPK